MKPKPSFLILFLIFAAGVGWGEEGVENARPPGSESDLKFWLETMVWDHGFTTAEIRAATGMSEEAIITAQKKFDITGENGPEDSDRDVLKIRPYPGGRHPRIGFLEGAIRPQRETKVSVFAPWDDGSGYVIVDVPEAIWSNLGLTYLAHTHVETIWTKQGVDLPKLEWIRLDKKGSLCLERKLPNGVVYRANVKPRADHVAMELKLHNGTDSLLTDLRVQNCVMLKNAPGFTGLTNDNKRLDPPFAAAQSSKNPKRWVITAWEPCHRPWGNAKVPCLHSDPKFPDCPPGETRKVRGWLSFYEGDDLDGEFARIREQFGLEE